MWESGEECPSKSDNKYKGPRMAARPLVPPRDEQASVAQGEGQGDSRRNEQSARILGATLYVLLYPWGEPCGRT